MVYTPGGMHRTDPVELPQDHIVYRGVFTKIISEKFKIIEMDNYLILFYDSIPDVCKMVGKSLYLDNICLNVPKKYQNYFERKRIYLFSQNSDVTCRGKCRFENYYNNMMTFVKKVEHILVVRKKFGMVSKSILFNKEIVEYIRENRKFIEWLVENEMLYVKEYDMDILNEFFDTNNWDFPYTNSSCLLNEIVNLVEFDSMCSVKTIECVKSIEYSQDHEKHVLLGFLRMNQRSKSYFCDCTGNVEIFFNSPIVDPLDFDNLYFLKKFEVVSVKGREDSSIHKQMIVADIENMICVLRKQIHMIEYIMKSTHIDTDVFYSHVYSDLIFIVGKKRGWIGFSLVKSKYIEFNLDKGIVSYNNIFLYGHLYLVMSFQEEGDTYTILQTKNNHPFYYIPSYYLEQELGIECINGLSLERIFGIADISEGALQMFVDIFKKYKQRVKVYCPRQIYCLVREEYCENSILVGWVKRLQKIKELTGNSHRYGYRIFLTGLDGFLQVIVCIHYGHRNYHKVNSLFHIFNHCPIKPSGDYMMLIHSTYYKTKESCLGLDRNAQVIIMHLPMQNILDRKSKNVLGEGRGDFRKIEFPDMRSIIDSPMLMSEYKRSYIWEYYSGKIDKEVEEHELVDIIKAKVLCVNEIRTTKTHDNNYDLKFIITISDGTGRAISTMKNIFIIEKIFGKRILQEDLFDSENIKYHGAECIVYDRNISESIVNEKLNTLLSFIEGKEFIFYVYYDLHSNILRESLLVETVDINGCALKTYRQREPVLEIIEVEVPDLVKELYILIKDAGQ